MRCLNTPPCLTEHLVLNCEVGVIQVQQQLLKEELEMRGAQFRAVVFGQAGEPEPHAMQSRSTHLGAAVIQTLQKLCRNKKSRFSAIPFVCCSILIRQKSWSATYMGKKTKGIYTAFTIIMKIGFTYHKDDIFAVFLVKLMKGIVSPGSSIDFRHMW